MRSTLDTEKFKKNLIIKRTILQKV